MMLDYLYISEHIRFLRMGNKSDLILCSLADMLLNSVSRQTLRENWEKRKRKDILMAC